MRTGVSRIASFGRSICVYLRSSADKYRRTPCLRALRVTSNAAFHTTSSQTKTEGAPAAGPSLRHWSSGSRGAEIAAEVYHTRCRASTPGTGSGLSSGKGGNKRRRGEQKTSLLH